MKKKLISALLCVAMVSSMLIGCGSSAAEEPAAEAPAAEARAEPAGAGLTEVRPRSWGRSCCRC